jgi:hypothetical protein
MRRGAIDAQEHKRRLPCHCTRLRVGGERPDVGIPVLGGSHDSVGVGRPIDRGDCLVVLLEIRVG